MLGEFATFRDCHGIGFTGVVVCIFKITLFIFTTDEKPTVVYPILDEIPTTHAFSSVNWCKIDVFTFNNNKNTK